MEPYAAPECALHSGRPAEGGTCSRCGCYMCRECVSPPPLPQLCRTCGALVSASIDDGWMRASRALLWAIGTCYLLIGTATAALMLVAAPAASSDVESMIMVGVITVVCVPVAGANFAAAVGLRRRKKWAWIAALVLAALYATSICLPFGAVIGYALLRGDVRRQFGF